MGRNIITGIDVGTSTIKIIVAEQKGDKSLNILAAAQKFSQGIRRGYITNYDETLESISSTLKSAEKISGIPIKHAYVAVGGISLGSIKSKGSVMIARADGEVTSHDIKRAMEQCESFLPSLTNKQIIHEIPLSFKIDNNPVLGKPVGMKGSKLEVEALYITSLNQHLSDLIKTIESSGVSVDDVVPSPLAASIITLSKHQKEAGCALANIGAGTVSLVVFEESNPISLEVFPIGSIHVTNDIALGLQVPLEEAERMKIENNSNSVSSKRKLNDIIEARLSDIFELIESHLKKIGRNGLLPAGIILTGGGSELINIEEIAKSSLRLPAKVSSPVAVQLQNQGVTISGPYKEQVLNDPKWSVALGLCVEEIVNNAPSKKTKLNVPINLKSAIKRWSSIFLP